VSECKPLLCGADCFSAIVSAALGRQGLSLRRPCFDCSPQLESFSFRILLSSTQVRLLQPPRRYLEDGHVKIPPVGLLAVAVAAHGLHPRPLITSTRVILPLSSAELYLVRRALAIAVRDGGAIGARVDSIEHKIKLTTMVLLDRYFGVPFTCQRGTCLEVVARSAARSQQGS
jgi:hypothetical protein